MADSVYMTVTTKADAPPRGGCARYVGVLTPDDGDGSSPSVTVRVRDRAHGADDDGADGGADDQARPTRCMGWLSCWKRSSRPPATELDRVD